MDEDEQHKEVYAHFGLACYFAQVLEHAIINSLILTQLIPSYHGKIESQNQWEEIFDSFMEKKFEKTLGQLIITLGKSVPVPCELERELLYALSKRNWIIHHYFRENAENFFTFNGRVRMINELIEIQRIFQESDSSLNQAMKPYRERYGFTDEEKEKAVHEYMTKIVSNQ